mgnify:CR=1 FL=1
MVEVIVFRKNFTIAKKFKTWEQADEWFSKLVGEQIALFVDHYEEFTADWHKF